MKKDGQSASALQKAGRSLRVGSDVRPATLVDLVGFSEEVGGYRELTPTPARPDGAALAPVVDEAMKRQ